MGAVIVAFLGALMVLFLAPEPLGDELVVVVPSADGHIGTVIVERGGKQLVLDTAFAASRIVAGGAPEPEQLDGLDEVRVKFASVLSALPDRPKSFLVYFLEATDELTQESSVEFASILAELRERAAPDIVVIGHTDRVGNLEYNDQLSLQRAERVRSELVRLGIPQSRIRIAGRGEREPLVATDDEIAEPRNRRVEIDVR